MNKKRFRLTTTGPVIIVIVLLITFAILGIVSSRLGEQNLQQAIRAVGQPITTTSAKLLFNPLYTLDVAQINNILEQYVDKKAIVHAAVYDADGKRVSQVAGQWSPEQQTSSELAKRAIAQNAQAELQIDQYLILSTPISVGGQIIGAVEFAFDQAAMRASLGSTQLQITIMLVVMLLGTALLFFFLIRMATLPLSRLGTAAQKIGAGDLSAPVPVEGAVEIASLAMSLETMRTELLGSYNELQEVLSGLEQRVEERTAELQQRSTELEAAVLQANKRALQLQAISEIARAIATIQNLSQLLPNITQAVSEKFGFYHVGVFLADEANEFAVLSAANSEGGRRMLARKHRLKIGQVGIVGNAVGSGKPRIALDTGADSIYFNNPDLPDTRSEIALPLLAGRQVIGALDVQSTESDAFTEEDIEVLTTLADQISSAIQNARLFEETEKALAEAENISRQQVRMQWAEFSKREGTTGYKYDITGTLPLKESVNEEEAILAQTSGKAQLIEKTHELMMSIPINLRGEVIGVLNVRAPGGRSWDSSEVDIVQAVADRVAISAENARLLEDSQRRAAKEQAIGEITTKIGASINMRNVLQTAVEELGRAMPGSEILIQFQGKE